MWQTGFCSWRFSVNAVYLTHEHSRFLMPHHPSVTGSSCASCLLIHQRPQMEHSVDTGPNNQEQSSFHWWQTRQMYCCFSYPLVSSLYTSASSLPVVYSNVVWMEQLVVTWGWLCCSHSDIFKGGGGRRHCCLWSVDDSPACCTSSTLAVSWWERSRASVQWQVQYMPSDISFRLPTRPIQWEENIITFDD